MTNNLIRYISLVSEDDKLLELYDNIVLFYILSFLSIFICRRVSEKNIEKTWILAYAKFPSHKFGVRGIIRFFNCYCTRSG